MRILFVSPRQCWPAAGGSKLREYHFLRALGERSELTYVFLRELAFDAPAGADLPFCRKLVCVPRPPLYDAGRLIRGLVGRWPLPVANYTSREMMETIRSLTAATEFDAVHFDSTHMAAYVALVRRMLPRARIFFNWHNIESEGMRRYAEVTRSPLKKLYARITARRFERVEIDLLRTSDGHFVCSDRERRFLLGLVPGAPVAVAENGVDTSSFPEKPDTGQRILYVGLMAYHANADAIIWFAREVWPKLRERFPDKILTVVGARPTEPVLALGTEPGVEITGTVPDVKPYYREAFAAIAPLRTGAGTRLKILEAMAARVPVISTAVGAEGLQTEAGVHILIAETPQEWLSAFAKLSDDNLRASLIRAARELVCSRYDWTGIRTSIYQTFSEWTGQR